MTFHNVTGTVQAQTATNLSQFQLGIVVSLLWIGVVILIIGVYWISKRYPKKKEKLDPIYKGVFLVLLIFLVHATAVAIGVLSQDTLKENLYLYAIAIVVAIIFYSLVGFFANRTIPSWKLWKNYVLPEIKRFWGAEPYKGKGYGMAMSFYQTIEGTNKSALLAREGIEIDAEKVQVFIGKVIFANIFEYLAVANKKTGEILRLQARPPLSQKQELTTRDFISSYQHPLEEFDTKEGKELEGE